MRKILFAALVLGATPAMAQDEADDGIGGLRVEARAGIERPNLNTDIAGTTYVDSLGSGFTYGGEIGYDIPVSSSITVGPYVSIDAGGSDKCEAYDAGPGFAGTACFHSKSDLSVGARVGVNLGPKTELYVGIGYDKYDLDFSDRVINTTTSAIVSNYVSGDARDGLGVSFGANFDLSKNLYVGVGMRVTEAGDFEGTDINLQRFQGHVAIGFRM